MNTLKLIDLVEVKEALWNPKNSLYHNRDIKHLIWSDIALQLRVSRETVKTKWSSLRDSFRRELRKRSDPYYSGTKPEWALFNRMMFLAPVINIKDVDLNKIDETYKDPKLGVLDLPFEIENGLEYPALEDGPPSEGSGELTNSGTSGLLNGTSNDLSAKYYSACYSKMLVEKRMRKERKRDEDYQFLVSLYSSMKRIRPEQKMKARIQIMQIIEEALADSANNREADLDQREPISPGSPESDAVVIVKEEPTELVI